MDHIFVGTPPLEQEPATQPQLDLNVPHNVAQKSMESMPLVGPPASEYIVGADYIDPIASCINLDDIDADSEEIENTQNAISSCDALGLGRIQSGQWIDAPISMHSSIGLVRNLGQTTIRGELFSIRTDDREAVKAVRAPSRAN